MEVLLTGGSGKVGTAITDHLSDEHTFTNVDPTQHPDCPTVQASVENYDAIRPAFDGVDAVVHLAVYVPGIVDENWERITAVNITGTYNVMEAARDADVPRVIFASTNHVVGGYEDEHRPRIYRKECDFAIDHTDPVRPDSFYGVSKLLGEHMGCFYVEQKVWPERFYALRIASLRGPEADHPYADAEAAVERGEIERGSPAYEAEVTRLKATWLSRRDGAQLVDRLLMYDDRPYDVFFGVSGNCARFHDIEHAKRALGYRPRDDAAEWTEPPDRSVG